MPGGWSSTNRIHFIGHSMGCQVVRYMQYLLSIDYFELAISDAKPKLGCALHNFDYKEDGFGIVDKSDWIASLTSLNGMMNGSSGPHALDLNDETQRFETYTSEGKATPVSNGF